MDGRFDVLWMYSLFHSCSPSYTLTCLRRPFAYGSNLTFAVDEGVDGVVATEADVTTRVEARAALAQDDGAGQDDLTVVSLHAEALPTAIAIVVGAARTFLVCHLSIRVAYASPSLPSVDSAACALRRDRLGAASCAWRDDLLYRKPCERLAVARPLAEANLRLVLENHFLWPASLADNFRHHFGAGYRRVARRDLLAFSQHEHVRQLDFIALCDCESLNVDLVADFDPILLTARAYYGVDRTPP